MIILHAGGENGWIDGADLVLQSKKATGDYLDEMSTESALKRELFQLVRASNPKPKLVVDVMAKAAEA